jgi:tetratricopeptide (TPR) repeat protein
MYMVQTDRERLLTDIHSEDHATALEAARGLLKHGDFGMPAGTYLLTGAKAALHLGRLADAVVLTYHGLKVAQPNTVVWAEMLANRAVACSRHGFYYDAIAAGQQFLAAAEAFPEFAKWRPWAHHAIGLSHDRLHEYGQAVPHHRQAAETYSDPASRVNSTCDLVYSLTLSGEVDQADQALSQVQDVQEPLARFVVHATTALVRYHQGRHVEAMLAGNRAEAVANENQAETAEGSVWELPLAELRYWVSHAAWETGDRYRAAALAWWTAIIADKRRHYRLLDAANEWLAEIVKKGGVLGDA